MLLPLSSVCVNVVHHGGAVAFHLLGLPSAAASFTHTVFAVWLREF
jgi:hypothetical protein